MIDPSENLSPQGMARREAILQQTLLAVRQRRRRRQTLQLAAGLAVVVLAAVLIRLPRHPGAPLPDRNPIEVVNANAPQVTPRPGPIVQIIPPDPGICARLAAPSLPPTWRTIDDDQFLAALAEAGQPAGLVRIAGQTLLMSHQ